MRADRARRRLVVVVLAVLTASLLFRAEPAWSLAGVGLQAVRGVLGHDPATLDELRFAIEDTDARLERDPGDAEANYARAVLMLNDKDAVELEEVRGYLQRAIVVEPERFAAVELWDALIPTEEELKAADEALEARGEHAPAILARALVRVRLGELAVARRLAERAAQIDPGLGLEKRWIEMVVAFLDEQDEDGTEIFQELTEDLKPRIADRFYDHMTYVATPKELRDYSETPVEELGAFIRSFWRRRDPFPLSAENERLGEHLRRIAEVRSRFPAGTNGIGYLTLKRVFKQLSPDLPFYSSDVVFDYVEARDLWLDHRGLVALRHGAPDVFNRSGITGARSETWLYYRNTLTPLLFHFVDRLGVGEFVMTLNLAQAVLGTRHEDSPERLIQRLSHDPRELYQRRSNFHRVLQAIASSRSGAELQDLLEMEAELMASFIKQVWAYDTTTLLKAEDRLPFGAFSATFADGDQSDVYIYYAIPEHELEVDSDELRFEAEMILYTDDWLTELHRATHAFTFVRPPGKRPKDQENLLVGALRLEDLEPGRYSYAFQLREVNSGLLGVSKGKEVVSYFGKPWVDLSGLVLADEVRVSEEPSIFERNGLRVVPIPTRIVKRMAPIQFYYEIYDLGGDGAGDVQYDITYKVLKIQGEPSLMSKLFGFGMNIAGAFFPYYTFLARAGLFGLSILTTGEEEGLTTVTEEKTVTADVSVARETFTLDPREYDKGIYQFYVTVLDRTNGSLDTESMRFVITD